MHPTCTAAARPRRQRLTGVEALTAGERRVAQMAAAGMTNREIAQALFVTMKDCHAPDPRLREARDRRPGGTIWHARRWHYVGRSIARPWAGKGAGASCLVGLLSPVEANHAGHLVQEIRESGHIVTLQVLHRQGLSGF